MLKKYFFKISILLSSLSLLFSVPAYATTKDEAVARFMENSEFSVNEEQTELYKYASKDSKEEIESEMVQAMKNTFRYSYIDGFDYNYEWKNGNETWYRYYLSTDLLLPYCEEETWIQEWLSANMSAIVPDGTSRQDAIRTVFNWICDYADYEWDALGNDTLRKENQGIRNLIDTHTSVCAGYSKTFRAMLEYLPFNSEGYVSYENGSDHMKVAVIRYKTENGSSHIWNALWNGTEYEFYDTTFADTTGDRDRFYKRNVNDMIAVQSLGATPETLEWMY